MQQGDLASRKLPLFVKVIASIAEELETILARSGEAAGYRIALWTTAVLAT